MKYLKLFESLEDIHKICRKYKIKNYTINSDGSIDVDGSVNLSLLNLTKLPLKFRNVSGSFNCYHNQLTTLEGCPTNIRGNFYCDNNNLTSLEGSPNSVYGYFNCDYNNITSLEGAPTYVGGYFNCGYNKITSLEGFQSHIVGNFYCGYNPVFEIWKLFRDKSRIELFNDYDIIRGTDIVIDRLNDFLITIGKKPVKSVNGYNNI